MFSFKLYPFHSGWQPLLSSLAFGNYIHLKVRRAHGLSKVWCLAEEVAASDGERHSDCMHLFCTSFICSNSRYGSGLTGWPPTHSLLSILVPIGWDTPSTHSFHNFDPILYRFRGTRCCYRYYWPEGRKRLIPQKYWEKKTGLSLFKSWFHSNQCLGP